MLIQSYKCDYCGKMTEGLKDEEDRHTPLGWFRLIDIQLNYRKKNFKKFPLKDKNRLHISEDTDPEFCSLNCLLQWLNKEAIKITK